MFVCGRPVRVLVLVAAPVSPGCSGSLHSGVRVEFGALPRV